MNDRILDMDISNVADSIMATRDITKEQLEFILSTNDTSYLHTLARQVADSVYGKDIFTRGLIEFTNYCKNDCYYCGIRKSNQCANRYRLTKEDILACAKQGYELGFRTFVLQGGEDLRFSDEDICQIVSAIREQYPDCAVTLSIGEKSKESYRAFYNAGAQRYLLRHETANNEHYGRLHPKEMSLDNRKQCLYNLKEIGYQVGAGFMVGSPYQTTDTIFEDLQFIKELKPHMVGIGPFISHKDTPFANEPSGTLDMTLKLLSVIRLMNPNVLLPATTALGTINPMGRELGIQAGLTLLCRTFHQLRLEKSICYMIIKYALVMNRQSAEAASIIE